MEFRSAEGAAGDHIVANKPKGNYILMHVMYDCAAMEVRCTS